MVKNERSAPIRCACGREISLFDARRVTGRAAAAGRGKMSARQRREIARLGGLARAAAIAERQRKEKE